MSNLLRDTNSLTTVSKSLKTQISLKPGLRVSKRRKHVSDSVLNSFDTPEHFDYNIARLTAF